MNNLTPGREPRADTRDIHQPKETHKKGATCLALTFGTLLSSQGADAHDTRPGGPSIAAAVPRYAARCVRQAAGPGPAPDARSGGTQVNRRPPGGVPGARSAAGQAAPGPTRGR